MIGWIVFAVFLVGWLGFTVAIARFMAVNMFTDDDAMERVLCVALALCAAFFWPLVIPGGWVYKKVWGEKK